VIIRIFVMRRFQSFHPVLEVRDYPVLRQEHAHGDAFEGDRPGSIGAPRQLEPRRAEELVK
jgi:hypothetical protein